MAKEKLPWFRWYPADAEMDEKFRCMSDADLGFYVRCLNLAWLNHGIPVDAGERARTLRVTRCKADARWHAVGSCFEERDGRLVNKRQEEERMHALAKSKKASVAAAHNGEQNRPGHVYFISRADGAIKIGSAGDVQRRLAQLRYKHKGVDSLQLFESIPVQNMAESEISLHNLFSEKRLNGEWFSLTTQDLAVAIAHITPGVIAMATGGDKSLSPQHTRARASDSDSGSGFRGSAEGAKKTPPADDDAWESFRLSATENGIDGSAPDWDAARAEWGKLAFEDRLSAFRALGLDLVGKQNCLPANYLRKRMWERPVRQAQNGRGESDGVRWLREQIEAAEEA